MASDQVWIPASPSIWSPAFRSRNCRSGRHNITPRRFSSRLGNFGWKALEKHGKNRKRVNGEIIFEDQKNICPPFMRWKNSCMYEVNHSIRWLNIYPSDHFLGLHPLIFQRFTRWSLHSSSNWTWHGPRIALPRWILRWTRSDRELGPFFNDDPISNDRFRSPEVWASQQNSGYWVGWYWLRLGFFKILGSIHFSQSLLIIFFFGQAKSTVETVPDIVPVWETGSRAVNSQFVLQLSGLLRRCSTLQEPLESLLRSAARDIAAVPMAPAARDHFSSEAPGPGGDRWDPQKYEGDIPSEKVID